MIFEIILKKPRKFVTVTNSAKTVFSFFRRGEPGTGSGFFFVVQNHPWTKGKTRYKFEPNRFSHLQKPVFPVFLANREPDPDFF